MQAVRRGLIHTYVPAAIAVVLLAAPSAAADTFKVNTGADLAPNGCTKGDCSVREAIIAANKHKGKDTVVLRSGRLHGLAIHGDDEDESKTGDLDVLGKTTIKASKKEPAVIHANGIDRVLHVLAKAKIIRLELTGGLTTQNSVQGLGLFAPTARVDVKRSTITGNTAAGNSTGGMSAHGGGTLVKSEVSFNEGDNTGGASLSGDADKPFLVKRSKIFENTVGGGLFISNGIVKKSEITDNEAVQCGGLDLNAGILTNSLVARNATVPSGMFTFGGGGVCLGSGSQIVGSEITQNTSAEDGGGVEVFGGEAIINSTIHDNLANDEGGGVSVLFSDPFVIERSTFTDNVAGTDGGGLRAGSARIIVKSSTFQGNEGVLGGGIVANDQPTGANDSVVDLRWSTISQNNSGSGGGIGGDDGGSYLSEGTVIDGNMGLEETDCDALVVSSGHNFVGDPGGCPGFNKGTDISGFPALLGPIDDYGGPTLTMKPKTASSLIDEGGNGCPSLDQRLKPRPKDDACDIGSVER
jgi:hypothetical protein